MKAIIFILSHHFWICTFQFFKKYIWMAVFCNHHAINLQKYFNFHFILLLSSCMISKDIVASQIFEVCAWFTTNVLSHISDAKCNVKICVMGEYMYVGNSRKVLYKKFKRQTQTLLNEESMQTGICLLD